MGILLHESDYTYPLTYKSTDDPRGIYTTRHGTRNKHSLVTACLS